MTDDGQKICEACSDHKLFNTEEHSRSLLHVRQTARQALKDAGFVALDPGVHTSMHKRAVSDFERAGISFIWGPYLERYLPSTALAYWRMTTTTFGRASVRPRQLTEPFDAKLRELAAQVSWTEELRKVIRVWQASELHWEIISEVRP